MFVREQPQVLIHDPAPEKLGMRKVNHHVERAADLRMGRGGGEEGIGVGA